MSLFYVPYGVSIVYNECKFYPLSFLKHSCYTIVVAISYIHLYITDGANSCFMGVYRFIGSSIHLFFIFIYSYFYPSVELI